MLILALSLPVGVVSAQSGTSSQAQSRTRAIAASFTKFKNVSKTKRGITKAKYLKVESEPVVKSNPADYSGVYQVPGMDFALDLSVDRNGVVTGSGYEVLSGSVKRTFTLRDGRVEGALLTATKVYAGGGTQNIEGAFMNRTSFESPTDKGQTVFGFGARITPVELDGNTFDRLFFDKVR